jgi:hypothetical protein
MEIVACPQCGAPAEAIDRGEVGSTYGPVRVVRLNCVNRHWYLLTRDRPPAVVPVTGDRAAA